MKKSIRVFWNINELANWRAVFDQQWEVMVSSGLAAAADEIILMANGRVHTFAPMLTEKSDFKNLRLMHVAPNATLFEYPGLTLMHKMSKEATEPFHICYIHLKGLTRWGNPYVEDWKSWLNWCVIERWRDNVEALQTHDTSGPNWEQEPWPHHSSNFWWANSNYVSTLDPLIHPHKLVSMAATQFKTHGHWRFDHEAWIGSKNPNAFEIAKSFESGGDHYIKPYPRELYRQD